MKLRKIEELSYFMIFSLRFWLSFHFSFSETVDSTLLEMTESLVLSLRSASDWEGDVDSITFNTQIYIKELKQAMEDFKAWYFKQPLVTRTYISAILSVTLLNRFGLISFYTLLFSWDLITSKLHLWRLFTDYFVIGSFNFNIVFTLFIIYFAFQKSEDLFNGPNFPDFLFLLTYLITFIDILAIIFNYGGLHRALSTALIYIWCKRKPFEQVQTYFGIRVQSAYFPWVLMGFHFLVGDDITLDLFGVAAGHSYVVLKDFLPITHNKRYLETPRFFQNLVNKYVTPYTQYGQRRRVHNQAPPVRQQFFQGQGVRLD